MFSMLLCCLAGAAEDLSLLGGAPDGPAESFTEAPESSSTALGGTKR